MTLNTLKSDAYNLDLTDAEVAEYGRLDRKATWERAIAAQKSLNAENAEENRKTAVRRAYQDPSAVVVVPLAIGAAVGTTVLRGIGSMLPDRKPKR